MTRTYRGDLAKSTKKANDAAPALAELGWFQTSQAWQQGSWGCGYFLIGLLLCLFVIGFVVLIAMLIVKPEGTLVVTYELRKLEPVDTP
jgi:hypothetical protein